MWITVYVCVKNCWAKWFVAPKDMVAHCRGPAESARPAETAGACCCPKNKKTEPGCLSWKASKFQSLGCTTGYSSSECERYTVLVGFYVARRAENLRKIHSHRRQHGLFFKQSFELQESCCLSKFRKLWGSFGAFLSSYFFRRKPVQSRRNCCKNRENISCEPTSPACKRF